MFSSAVNHVNAPRLPVGMDGGKRHGQQGAHGLMNVTINRREEREVLNGRARQKLKRHYEKERKANILDLSVQQPYE